MGIEVGVPNYSQQLLIGEGIPAGTVGLIIAVYWFMMLIGRFVGASIGSKISARAMIVTVSCATIAPGALRHVCSRDCQGQLPRC